MDITGVLKNWTLHKLSEMSAEQKAEFKRRHGEAALPYLITGEIVVDNLERWEAGRCMRTSWLTRIDAESMTVTTLNSVYLLEGLGLVTHAFPVYYEEVVGQATSVIGQIEPKHYKKPLIEIADDMH